MTRNNVKTVGLVAGRTAADWEYIVKDNEARLRYARQQMQREDGGPYWAKVARNCEDFLKVARSFAAHYRNAGR
jgi:hypothetical protein